jgi:hypothetical protein
VFSISSFPFLNKYKERDPFPGVILEKGLSLCSLGQFLQFSVGSFKGIEERYKFDATRLRTLGANGAVVNLRNAPGNGQANAEAAGLARARGIHPIEPVKEPIQFLGGHRLTGVFHPQFQASPSGAEEEGNLPAGCAIFDAVVQEDGNQPPKRRLIAAERQFLGNIQ